MKYAFVLFTSLLAGSCSPGYQHSMPLAPTAAPAAIRIEALSLFDTTRRRPVPVLLYGPVTGRRRLALLSHGYGGHNSDYSFLARQLGAHGYLVASIQHELPTDEPIATAGNLRETRRPNWARGVQNMLFVRQQLQQLYPRLDTGHLLLLGHSNGGDMAVLFAHEHPALVDKLISLDHRRMPLPRVRQPRILTIRSSDQLADPGVLPGPEEQKGLGISIVQLPATLHNDMWDGATKAQQQEITAAIAAFLRR
ncbi:serine aminopeptidase domain-containing protein [Hymenobacter lucidus]|uniref:Alpha/beta hydrolase n=1 Tax=Hymenobacter lucidus TaxID=2880930 RepID=A0ABS8AQN0_9BACT|nr:alpha/beta hydrolase [Hymenobacter lucidus]MCB2407913.1 alpha/beta hydrolase [Hymenobacter lucidus]